MATTKKPVKTTSKTNKRSDKFGGKQAPPFGKKNEDKKPPNKK